MKEAKIIQLIALRKPIKVWSGKESMIFENTLIQSHPQIRELYAMSLSDSNLDFIEDEEKKAKLIGAPVLLGFIGPNICLLKDGREAWEYRPEPDIQQIVYDASGKMTYLDAFNALQQQITANAEESDYTPVA